MNNYKGFTITKKTWEEARHSHLMVVGYVTKNSYTGTNGDKQFHASSLKKLKDYITVLA